MTINSVISLFLSVVFGVIVLSLVRLLWILPSFRSQSRPSRKSSAKIAIVLGSGGHTAEMLRLIEHLNFDKYTRRVYVVSSGDTLSEGKAKAFETWKHGSGDDTVCYKFSNV
jgi:beta-1,4-N-acetylglucosaminyltransferase